MLTGDKFMPKMQLKQPGFTYSVCAPFTNKYAWVVPLKDKKGVSIVNAFQKILNDSARKPNKIWVDKGSECYNTSLRNR